MKTRTSPRSETSPKAGLILCALAVLALIAVQPVQAAIVYWDINGATAGAGGATPAGTWDGVNTFWNSVSGGTGATAIWAAGDTAVFAAGTDATGIYTVTVGAGTTQDIGGLTFEEGTVTISGGVALRLVSNAIMDVASGLTATVSTVISEDVARTLTKTGAGTLTLSGTNAYTGATTIRGGTLTLSDTSGSIATSSGVTLANPTATLTLSNTAAANNGDRIANGLTANGGTFNFTNDAGAANFSETIGTLTLNAGALNFNAGQAALAQTSAFTTSTITRNAGSTVKFSGTGFGVDARNQVLVTTALNTQNVAGILPWAIINDGGTVDLAVGGAASAAITKYAGYTTGAETLWTANTVNARPSGATTTLTADRTINSLVLDTGKNLSGQNADRKITLGGSTFGTIVQTGGSSSISRNGNSEVYFSMATGAEVVINTVGNLTIERGDTNTFTWTASNASNSLTKSGAGTLYLGNTAGTGGFATSNLGGKFTINEGTVRITANNNATNPLGSGQVVLNGGRLEIAESANRSFNTPTVTVSADSTVVSDRYAASQAGITITLGNLSIGGQNLSVLGGSNVNSGTAGITLGTTTLTGSPTFTVTNPTAGGTTNLTLGAVSGTGYVITKTGNGQLTLNGAGTFDSGVTLNLGTLSLGNATALGATGSRLTINAGSLDASAGTTISNVNPVTVNSDFTFVGTNALNLGTGAVSLGTAAGTTRTITVTSATNALTLGGIISNGTTANALTKAGAGTLVLNGANAYTGPTGISAGTLTIGNAATFTNTSALNLSGTGRLDVNVANQSLAKLASGTGTGVVANTFLRYSQTQGTGTTGPGTILGTVELNVNNVNPNYTLDFGTNSTLTTLGSFTYNTPITLSGSATIDTAANVFSGGTSMTIGASTGGAKILTLTGTNTGANTIAGIISDGSGTVGVNKTAAGTWTLSGANSYTGATGISAGTLTIGNASTFTSTSAINLSGTGRLDVNVADQSLAKLASPTGTGVVAGTFLRYSQTQTAGGTGPGTILGTVELNVNNVNPNYTLDFGAGSTLTTLGSFTYNTPITLSGSATIDAAANVFSGGTGMTIGASTGGAKTLTLAGTNTTASTITGNISDVSGTVGVAKSGAGTWILSGTNNNTGPTTINATGGMLQFAKAASLYNGIDTSWTQANITVNNAGTLAFNVGGAGEFTTGNVTTLLTNLDRAVNNNGLLAGSKLGFDTTSGSFVINDGIADTTGTGGGAVSLTKLGVNTLTLNAVNTASGPVLINGTLAIGGAGQLNSGKSVSVTINSGGLFQYGSSANQTLSGTVTGAGALTKTGSSTLVLSGTSVNYSGATTINQGTLRLTGTSTNSAIAVNSGGTLALNGVNWTAASAITLNTGTLITDENNGFVVNTPVLTVSDNSILRTNGTGIAGNFSEYFMDGGLNIASTKTLTFYPSTEYNGIVLRGNASSSGSLVVSGAGTTYYYPGRANLQFNTAGAPNFANTDVTLTNATMNIGVGLNNDANTAGATIKSLSGNGKVYDDVTSNTLTVGANDGSGTFSGLLANGTATLSLLKTGAGTQVLSGPNTYTGTTTVNGGILRAGNATAFGPAGNATLAFGASSTGKVQLYLNSMTVVGLNTNVTPGTPILESGSGTAGTDTLTVNNAAANTFAGVLQDGSTRLLALTKTANGTLTLSGANTYTGGTNVNGGTLLWSGANNLPATGTLAVGAGGNFSLADGTARATTAATTGTALTLAGGSTLTFDWAGAALDSLTATGTATATGNIGIIINNATPSGGGGTLVTAAGGSTLSSGTYYLANNTNYTATLTSTATTIGIGAQSAVTALTNAYWLGGQVTNAVGAMALSSGTTSNWASAAAGTLAGGVVPGGSAVNAIFGATGAAQQANVTTGADMNLGSINFNDTAAVTIGGNNYITLNNTSGTAATTTAALATVTAGSAISVTTYANVANTINANLVLGAGQTWNVATGKTLTVNGVVNGTNSLTIGTSGNTGTVVLAGANRYTGNTAINYGTVKAGGPSIAGVSGPLGNKSAVTMGNNAGATLDLNGNDLTIGSLAGGGTTGGNVTLGANTLTTGGNNTNTTYSGLMSSSAGVTGVSLNKIGSGTLNINNANNSFTGNIVIDGGWLEYGVDHNLGASPGSPVANNISIINGGTLYDDNGGDNAANLGGNRGIYLGPGNQTFRSQSGDWHIAGVISGPGGIWKTRAGGYSRLYLDNANTFTGDTYFNGDGSTGGYGGVQINTALALQYSALNTNSSGSNFGAPVNLICGGLIGNGAFGTGGITGSTLTSITLQPQIVGLTKAYSGVLSGAAGMTLTLNGPGTQALNGLNTYTGATSIKAGVLSINTIQNVSGGASSLGAPTTVPNGTIAIGNTSTSATLMYTGTGDTTDRVINLAGTTGGATLDQSGSGTLTFSSALTATVAGAKTLTLQGSTAGSGVIGGTIVDSSAGATSLAKAGTGTWTLSAANTYTGDTTLGGGTLTIGNLLALQNSALNYTSGTLGFSSGINTPTFGGLTGSTSLSVAANVTALTLNPGTSVTHTYSGSLGSDLPGMNLAKSGAGAQVLGAATYTGTTAVNVGKLYLNGSNATTAITVAGAATLGGSGTAASATATVASTGIVEAGYSGAGTLTLGGLTFGSSSTDTATVKIANFSTYSINPALNVTNSGGLAVNGNAGTITIALTSGSVPASGTAHLIQYNNPIGGTGAGFSAFALNTAGLGAGPRALFGLVDNITGSPTNYVDLSYSTDYPVWSGAGLGNWITSAAISPLDGDLTNTNWVLNSSASTQTNFIAGDKVVFDDSVGGGTTTVNISTADVSPASVTFDNENYTLQSTGGYGITGGTSLTKSNSGRLIVTTDNTYNGGTIISGGTIQVGNATTTGTLGSGEINNNGVLEFNRTNLLTMAQAISGTGSVVQNGSNTLELNGANSYQGGTTLNSGTLKLGNATALGTGTLTINGCALDSGVASLVLTSDNVQVWNSDFNFAGTNDLDLGIGAVSLGSTAGARTVTVDTGTLTVGGIISNGTATALTKAGAGALVLGGANLYSGGTTVNVGTVTVSDGAALGAGPLAVNNPSTGSGTAVVLNLNGSVATGSLSGAIAVPGTNTATINIASAKTLTVNQAVDGIYAGVIAGSGALAKSSAAKLTLTGLNSYSGGTMLSQGVLSINSFSDTVPSALGVGPNGITFNGGTLQYTGHAAVTSTRFTLAGGNQAFDITQSDANFTVAASYSASTITKLGAGTLTFGGAVGWDHENYGNGAIAVDNGTVVLDANVYTTGGNNPLFHAAFATVNDVQSPATLKLGTTYNNIKLNFANTFHMSGGTYDINGMTNNGCAQIDGSGTITNNGAADATVNVFANLTNAFSGNIVDGTPHKTGLLLGNVGGFGGSGAAVWTLSGANTYSGPTTAGVGTLKAGSATAFSPNSAFTVGATLDLAGFNNQIAGLTGAGTVKSSAGTAILTVNNDVATSNADFIFGGVLRDGTVPEGSGVLGLTKTGSKILTLSGANAYTGNTTISNGTLALTGSGSIANSPTIDVALGSFFDVSGVGGGYTLGASQTLKGNGTVIGPMTAAGTVAPGYSTGVLTVTGDATLNGTFSVDVETDGDSDRLDVTGNLALGPASVLSIVDIDQLLYGLPYTIATYGGTQSGTFAGGTNLPVGWSVEYGPQSSSGAITLTPEPATLALLGLGGLGLILSRKRK